MVALAYDAWLPPGVVFPDDAVHAEVMRKASGVSLELGTGNGRFLIPRLEEGLAVEGVDSSADMLERCRRHAKKRGLGVVLHHGDMAPLRLDRRYAAMCCPAGSFTLVADVEQVQSALTSYLDHLEPEGTLAITMFVPDDEADTGFTWRLRRTGTAADGITYLVHEATGLDRREQVELVYNRIEVVGEQGHVTETLFRKHLMRWWTQPQLTELFGEAGFVEVSSVGSTDGWVTVGRRP